MTHAPHGRVDAPHRVLLQQTMWQPYRVPLARWLRERSDLDVTVAHGEPQTGSALVPGDVSHLLPVVRLRNAYIGRPARVVWQNGLVREIRSGRYDVAIAAMDPRIITNLIGREAARRARVAWVWWGHGIRPRGRFRRLYAWLARDADSCILYSEEGRQQLIAAGAPGDRLYVAPNGLDTDAAARLRRDTPFASRTAVLYVGRLLASKRVDRLIDAFRLALPRLRPDSVLVIIGDGPDRARLGELAADLSGRVQFVPGTYDDTRLAEHYNRAWAAVSPAAAGLSVMQAFQYGVPYVLPHGVPHGPEAAVVAHGVNGLWCELAAPEPLAQALVQLDGDRDHAARLGAAGVRTVDGRFSARAMAEGFVRAVEAAVHRQRGEQ
ncbi:MAG TPA: glycosyltransferase family 4 protein [Chthonomonadales bacterium]|nr:glycosyltransferase family 4 protein [Chthonomonadales bacterium]